MSKLLLLEDDLSLIDGLTYSLNKAGYQVDVARTVGEALERLSKPDCLDSVSYTHLDVYKRQAPGLRKSERACSRYSTN